MRGGQWQALRLMRELRTLGCANALYAPSDAPLARAAAAEGFEMASWRRVARGYDLLHCHTAGSHSLAALAARRPFVVARRVGFPVGTGALSRWKYGRAAGFLAVSEYAAARLRDAGVPDGKIRVVADAVPLPERISDYSAGAIAAATDDPRKARAILRASGLDVVMSVNLERDLAFARVFVYLSEMEGLGSAALLAMAFGVPVVASRVGGLPEIVEHERTGLLVENDPAEVRRAVERLLGDSELARRLGSEGRARAARFHSPALMAARTLEFYREILE
jgi:hypothetical protein